MKNILLMMCMLLVSCTNQAVKSQALLPAIQSAWPGVKADIEVSRIDGLVGPGYVGYAGYELEIWSNQVFSGNFKGMDLSRIERLAHQGVDNRLLAEEIGSNGAQILKDRATNFVDAIRRYMGRLAWAKKREERRWEARINAAS